MNKKTIVISSVIFLLLSATIVILFNYFYKVNYIKEFSSFKEESFEATLQANIELNIPKDLVANEAEWQLLSSSNKIIINAKEKETVNLNHMTLEAIYNNNKYNYQSFSNDETALLFNGFGWYSYSEKPKLTEITISKILNNAISSLEDSDFKFKVSKQEIIFNNEKTNAISTEIILSDKNILDIESKFNLSIDKENPKITIYSLDEKRHLVEFDLVIEKETAYEKKISANLKGTLFLDRSKPVEINKPETSNIYDNDADFLIDLIIK